MCAQGEAGGPAARGGRRAEGPSESSPGTRGSTAGSVDGEGKRGSCGVKATLNSSLSTTCSRGPQEPERQTTEGEGGVRGCPHGLRFQKISRESRPPGGADSPRMGRQGACHA